MLRGGASVAEMPAAELTSEAYRALLDWTPTPVVELNAAVADIYDRHFRATVHPQG